MNACSRLAARIVALRSGSLLASAASKNWVIFRERRGTGTESAALGPANNSSRKRWRLAKRLPPTPLQALRDFAKLERLASRDAMRRLEAFPLQAGGGACTQGVGR